MSAIPDSGLPGELPSNYIYEGRIYLLEMPKAAAAGGPFAFEQLFQIEPSRAELMSRFELAHYGHLGQSKASIRLAETTCFTAT